MRRNAPYDTVRITRLAWGTVVLLSCVHPGRINPGLSTTTCDAVPDSFDIYGEHEFSGVYDVIVVSHSTNVGKSAVIGTIGLMPSKQERFQLVGTAVLELSQLGTRPLAVPMDSRDPERPGVYGVTTPKRLTFVIGGGGLLDAGVGFTVLRIRGDTLQGSWQDYADAQGARGHFCALRRRGNGKK